jgi:glucose-6-phosphate 1-epimerase
VVSWKAAGRGERLFLSRRSSFQKGKAIRGGIPVAFPQFAELGPLVKHGFARTIPWQFRAAAVTDAGSTVSFRLESSPQTRAAWPGEFRLELFASLGAGRLEVELRVANAGNAPFAFAGALHTYLAVSDAAAARLHGLEGIRYRDREARDAEVEARRVVTAKDPIDRVYFAAPRNLRLEDGGEVTSIEQRGFGDTVVWNPGRELTATMPDMEPEGYRGMLCVEAAVVAPAVRLAPGAAWSGAQILTVS